MQIKTTSYLSLAVFLYLFFIFDPQFHGPDEPIYYAYTASIIEDGDLNAVNHLDEKYPYYLSAGDIGISKMYNLPDFHDHGGVVLWAPFYLYGKLAYFMMTKISLSGGAYFTFEVLTKCAMSFSTITFAFLTILLTYLLCKAFFSEREAILSTLLVFFGTPFFYYVLFEPGNANIVAALFSIVFVWFCIYAISIKKSQWLCLGLFFSVSMVVKVDLWFQIFFIIIYFLALLMLRQIRWVNGVYFLLGLLPAVALKMINEYLKYGTFHSGVLGLFNSDDSYLFEQLFSTYRGFFYTSPIYYVCIAGFIFAIIRLMRNARLRSKESFLNLQNSKELLLIILSLHVFIKIIIISNRYAWGGGTCGARPLITEFPIFVLLYARALWGQRKNIKYCSYFISALFVFWNFLIIAEYMIGTDLEYAATGAPSFMVRFKEIKNIFAYLFYFKDLGLKIILCLPLIPIILSGAYYIVKGLINVNPSLLLIKARKQPLRFKTFFLLTVYLYIAYTGITLLNVCNNQKNVEILKTKLFFKDAKIIGPYKFEKEENIGSMDEMIEYFSRIGDFERAKKIEKNKIRYMQRIYKK